MQYTNLIWDFDGMLFNTYPRMAAAFQQALADMGVTSSIDEIMPRIKRSVGKAAREYAELFRLDRESLSAQYHLREHAMPPETMLPYDGICELLRDAAQAGCRHFLYTHRDHSALDALERYGVKSLFSGFVTVNDPFPPKPAPDALLSILSRHQLAPEACVMLGDRDIDILAARNAGISGILYDPERFYNHFEHSLRTNSVSGLRTLLGLP